MQTKWQKKDYFGPMVMVTNIDLDVVTASGEFTNDVGERWDWKFDEFEE